MTRDGPLQTASIGLDFASALGRRVMERALQLGSPMTPLPGIHETSVLLIAEGRAVTEDWPSYLGETPDSGWALVEQEEWEGLPEFLGRVNTVLSRDALDAPERTVFFVASAWRDHTDVAARRLLVLEVLTHLARTGGGKLVLTHDHLRDGDSCAELAEMVSDLAADWEDSGVSVTHSFDSRVRLAEAEMPESRVSRPAPSRVHQTRPALEPLRVAAG